MYILRRLSFRSFCGSLAIAILLCSLVYALLGSHLRLIAASNFELIKKSASDHGVINALRPKSSRINSSEANLKQVLVHPTIPGWETAKPNSNQKVPSNETFKSQSASKVIQMVPKILPGENQQKAISKVKLSTEKKLFKNKTKTLLKGKAQKSKKLPAVFHIPGVPAVSVDDTVVALPESVIKQYLKIPKCEYREEVLILTPIHNVADRLNHYANMLKDLTYPHNLISVSLGEDCSTDETLTVARTIVEELSAEFKAAKLLHFNLTGQITGRWSVVHDRGMQWTRRKHLAKSRNLLLRNSLKEEPWVLWIDSDVSHLPKDLIQQLLSADKDIVAPCCLFKDGVNIRVYDKNTWRETKYSLEMQRKLPPKQLVLEGYGPSTRLYLPHLRAEGRVVPIDGVGGCSLLVRGNCHRKGLIFPEEIYQHHIETEGLSKLAKSMGFSVYGMPFVEVYH